MMQSNLRLQKALWVQLKIYALKANVTVTEAAAQAIEEFLTRKAR